MKVCTNLKTKFNLLSKIFQPITVVPKDAIIKKSSEITSKSQRLMIDLGIIRPANHGNFHFLPLGLRSMNKLIKLVDVQMEKVGAQKLMLPTLTDANLWKKTGRLEDMWSELFTLKDRHNKTYVLSPTHEESITDLVASVFPLSYKQLPLRLYQITSKFRDEIKPRFGLLRCRQFIMKDLYTFDKSIENAKDTYEDICKSYESLFDELDIKYVKVLGTTGNIGGFKSHEYHFLADIGEDQLLLCKNCNYTANIELCENITDECPKCKSNETNIHCTAGIEVGHTFLLGDKYSKILQANFLTENNKNSVLQMGCYGLGISRILAASIESLSSENEIKWPISIAPYISLIISPKKGSKEETITEYLLSTLYDQLNLISKDDVLIDDRNTFTIGKRLLEAKKFGYPFIIVIGKAATKNPPLFELHDTHSNTNYNLTQNDLLSYIKNKLSKFKI